MNNKEQNGFRVIAAIVVSSLCLSGVSMTSYANTTTTSVKSKQAATNPKKADDKTVQAATDEDSIPSDDDMNTDEAAYNKDPLEKFNRAMFTFNDTVDTYLIKPVAKGYNVIMPKPLNQGVHNFFNNLGELPTIANDLLQFNFYQMFKDFSRLVINSTMGVGGLFDVATRMNLPYFQNDFGLTMAAWGYQNSDYLVLPLMGPNTIRDGFAIPVDYFGFSVYPYVHPQSSRYQVLALLMIDRRAHLLQFEPVLEEAAIDKYVFMRNAYMQHRAFQIEQIKHLSYKERNNNDSEAVEAS